MSGSAFLGATTTAAFAEDKERDHRQRLRIVAWSPTVVNTKEYFAHP